MGGQKRAPAIGQINPEEITASRQQISDYGDSLLNARQFGASLDILDPNAAPGPQAPSRAIDAAQKARVIFELIVAPFILGREADQ